MIQGDVEFLWGILGCSLAVGLGVITMVPPRAELTPFLFSAVVTTTVVFPFVRSALNRRSLDLIDIEAAEDVYEMLKLKPDNQGARLRLARLLFQRNLRRSAIALAEDALSQLPKGAFYEEQRMLAGWKRSANLVHEPDTLPCLECAHRNPVHLMECERCGSEILLDHIRGRWVGRGLARKLLCGWAAMMLVLVGIPLATMLLPREGAAIVAIALLFAIVLILVLAFRPDRRRTA